MRCLNDNRGGLVLSFDGFNIPDKDFLEYRLLKIDKSVKSIKSEDLPKDFCKKACKLVDEFHRKTIHEKIEWMLYFDYTTGEVIYCWSGQKGNVMGDYENIHVHNRRIASVHNHPLGFYSFPSPDNFDILKNNHEDYEIIISIHAMWIVEFKGSIDKSDWKKFQQVIGRDIDESISLIQERSNVKYIDNITEEIIGNYLLNEVDKEIQSINLILIKKEFD